MSMDCGFEEGSSAYKHVLTHSFTSCSTNLDPFYFDGVCVCFSTSWLKVNGVRLGVSVGLVWVFGAVFGTLGPTITPTDAAERISLIS